MLEFFQFNQPNVIIVAIGSCLIGFFSGFTGVFLVLDKKSLLGDAISHSLLPGICIAFLFYQSKSPWVLLLGATISGLLSSSFIDLISERTKLSRDSALAISLSLFFSLGILILTYIQHHYPANQAGLESYLFGKAAAISESELYLIASVGGLSVLVLLIFYKELRLILFSRSFAQSMGLRVGFFRAILNLITVLIIAIGIQAVGVVLMASLILAPASIARFYSNSLMPILLLSGLIGATSGLLGTSLSYSSEGMPTGPWIVMVLFTLSVISLVYTKLKQRKNV
jgi:manganese/zinc/iron transport system permease protein